MTAVLNTNLAALRSNAGLAISERITAQLRGLAIAGRNAQAAVSLTQTADGSLSSVLGLLKATPAAASRALAHRRQS